METGGGDGGHFNANIHIWTQSKMLFVMLTSGKTQKYYFLNRM